MKISYGNKIKSNQLSFMEFDDLINLTKGDEALKQKIEELRQLQTDHERQELKIAKLPYFSMGRFQDNIRKKENLISIKALILDIDHLEQDQLETLKNRLKTDNEIYFFFTSPSGHGLKVAVVLDQEVSEADQYECVYRAYANFFSAKYGVEVDMHACDASRACFFSYDPDLYLNNHPEQVLIDDLLIEYEVIKDQGKSLAGKNITNYKLKNIIEFLITKNNETGTIYNNYRDWQLMGLSLASLGEFGRQHFLNLSIGNTYYKDTEDALNKEFDKLLKNYGASGKAKVGIGTIVYIAKQHGFVFTNDNDEDHDENITPTTTPVSAPTSSPPKTLKDELREIANLDSETDRDIALKALAAAKGASVRSLKNDLKAIMAEASNAMITDEKIILMHPAYDIKDGFLVIGFRETVIVNNLPEDRNIFLVSDGSSFQMVGEKFLKLDMVRIIFDMRGRELININDRWSRDAMNQFLVNPSPPEGLYNKIKATLKQHVDFQKPEYYGIIASWVIATFFHRCFFAFPYLNFFGKKQTAKTRALELLERLSFNAIKVKGTSVASFVDSVDGLRSTFLTDQAESLSDPRNVEIVGYHADSYTVGGGKRRIVQIVNGARKVLSFDSYSPKGYSAQKELDPDLRDRCIVIPMIRTDKEFPYPAAHLPIWGELRNDLYRLLLTKWQEVQKIYPGTGKDLSMRIRELWRPLETIMILEKVPDQEIMAIKKVFLEGMSLAQDELSDREEYLFEALLKLTEAKKDDLNGVSLAASDIGNQMKALAQAANTDLGFDKDRALFTWIGFAIKRLSLFTSRDTTKNARKHQYIFHHSHVKEIFDRFKVKVVSEDKKIAQPVKGKESVESNLEEILPDQIGEIMKSMMDNQVFDDT